MASSNRFSMNLGLSAAPETTNADVFAEAVRMYNAIKALAVYLDAYTGNSPHIPVDYPNLSIPQTLIASSAFKIYRQFDETVTQGQLVSIYSNAGVSRARLANATNNTRPCVGYCSEVGGVTSGSWGEITCFGIAAVTGITPGTRYYLSTVNGSYQVAAPTAAGNIEQVVGFALDTNYILFQPNLAWIQH